MTHRKIGIAAVLVAACGLAMAYGQTDQSSPAVDSDRPVGDSGMTMAELREVEEAREKAETLEYYEKAAFDPVRAGLLAISALAEIEAEPEERAEVFEELLSETKELGLRNALRMVLNEIYTDAGATDDVVENLSEMLIPRSGKPSSRSGPSTLRPFATSACAQSSCGTKSTSGASPNECRRTGTPKSWTSTFAKPNGWWATCLSASRLPAPGTLKRSSPVRPRPTDWASTSGSPIRTTHAEAFDWVVEHRVKHTYPMTAMRMLRELGGIRDGICIDIGCGTGNLDVELAQRSNFTIIGLDIDPDMKPLFEKRIHEADLQDRARFVVGDAQQLPFEDDSADAIVSRGTLTFIPDIGKCLREVDRVLKPTGVAFLGGRYLYTPQA